MSLRQHRTVRVLAPLLAALAACRSSQGTDINAIRPTCDAPFPLAGYEAPLWPQPSGGASSRAEDAPSTDTLMAWLSGTYTMWRVTTQGTSRPRAVAGTLVMRPGRRVEDSAVGTLTIGKAIMPVYLDYAPASGRLELSTATSDLNNAAGLIWQVTQLARLHDRWLLGGRWMAADNLMTVLARVPGVDFVEHTGGYFCAIRPRSDAE